MSCKRALRYFRITYLLCIVTLLIQFPLLLACRISRSGHSWFLGAFEKFRKATIISVMFTYLSSCLSVHMEQLDFHWTGFHEIWYLSIFRKSVKKIQDLFESDKTKQYFTWRQIYFLSYLAHFFLEWEMFQTKVVEKIKTPILYAVTFSFENRFVYEIM